MPDTHAERPGTGHPLGYQSRSLAAMLEVFALWGSGDFIASITAHAAPGLDPTSVTALTLLGRHGPTRPSALAHRLRVSASNVSKITRRLIDLELIDRVPDTEDARAGLLRLSPQGREVVEGFVTAGDAMMHAIQAEWSSTDRDQFTEMLTKFHTDALRFATANTSERANS